MYRILYNESAHSDFCAIRADRKPFKAFACNTARDSIPPSSTMTVNGTRQAAMRRNKAREFGMALGIALGAGVGTLFHNLAIGVAIGLSLGLAVGGAIGAAKAGADQRPPSRGR